MKHPGSRGLSTVILITILFLLIPWPSMGQDTCIRIGAIRFEGNKVTKESVIRRELSFIERDCLSGEELERKLGESHDNLMNTTLFNFVVMTIVEVEDTTTRREVDILIQLTERWYLWAFPILTYEDRNFSTWLANGDWSRISYGFTLTRNNFRGRKEDLALTLQYGYDRQAWIEYRIPYINRSRTLGLYLAGGVEYMHEVPYATIEGKRGLVKDDENFLLGRHFAQGSLILRPAIHTTHEFTVGFEDIRWGDTLLELNPAMTAGGNTDERYLRLHYKVKFDHRNYASYPLRGWYADFEAQKDGFGLFDAGGPDHFFLKSTLRRYIAFGNSFYGAAGMHLKLGASGRVPYYLNKSLGYGRDFVRGYEFYVIDGQSFGMIKGNLKYELLKPRQFRLPMPLSERLTKAHLAIYINLYADLARTMDKQASPGNILANRWLYSCGSGIDFVTYYDKVFRLDYSVNHMGEGGIYIHFIAPI